MHEFTKYISFSTDVTVIIYTMGKKHSSTPCIYVLILHLILQSQNLLSVQSTWTILLFQYAWWRLYSALYNKFYYRRYLCCRYAMFFGEKINCIWLELSVAKKLSCVSCLSYMQQGCPVYTVTCEVFMLAFHSSTPPPHPPPPPKKNDKNKTKMVHRVACTW